MAEQNKIRGLEIPLDNGQGQISLSAETFLKFDAVKQQAESMAKLPGSVVGSINSLRTLINSVVSRLGFASTSISGQNSRINDIATVLTQGIDLDKANSMLAADISQSEEQVRRVLSDSGVNQIPQNVFDGLVSFHNQVKDITYVFVKDEKIDMLPLYKAEDWDRVASFIAADERDRARRIQEATLIVSNDYGRLLDDAAIVSTGLDLAVENLNKGKLNSETGDPATDQQTVALATSYINQRDESLPGQNFAFNNLINENNLTEQITEIVKRQAGPWPY
jgi:hypothetical protein